MAASLDIGTKVKQPAESRLYAIDFVNLLATDDTLSSVTSVLANDESAETGITVGTGAISGTEVQFRLSGGNAGTTYKIECIAVTSGGDTLEGDGYIAVVD